MENKNKSILKVCHIVLIAVGLALTLFTLFTSNSSALIITMCLFRAAAFVASFIYLIKGYKKDADKFYKLFMWFLGISIIISYTSFINLGMSLPILRSFVTVMILVAFIFIIGANDYGKVKSNIISITLAILNIINIAMIFNTTNYILNPNVVIAIGQLFLALTATLMVWVKYQDKESRGAK